MSTTITLPPEYGFVVLTATGTFALAWWHALRVTPFRRAAKIRYPQAFAYPSDIEAADSAEMKKALYLFNCVQRAHGNFLENYPFTLAALLIAGLRFPITASVMGVGWSISRVLYAVGYTDKGRDDGKGRLRGWTYFAFQLGLIVLSGWTGSKMIV